MGTLQWIAAGLLIAWLVGWPVVVCLLLVAAKRADDRIGRLEWWSDELEDAEALRLRWMTGVDCRLQAVERRERNTEPSIN